jgi:hypothetical protein
MVFIIKNFLLSPYFITKKHLCIGKKILKCKKFESLKGLVSYYFTNNLKKYETNRNSLRVLQTFIQSPDQIHYENKLKNTKLS